MNSQFNFGRAPASGAAPANLKHSRKFRLAVLGDFSGRASRGERESGDTLAARKPLKVEADNLDILLARLAPRLKMTLPGTGTVELEFASMEDFHPDALYEKLEIFSKLSGLRSRLKTTSTYAKAAAELRTVGLSAPPELAPTVPATARGTVISAGSSLAELLQSLDTTPAAEVAADDAKSSFDAFMREMLAPHVTAAKNPQQEQFVAIADEAISAMMRGVLHHPDFQALEALWRSLAFLATRLDTDEALQISLIDLSAEEFVADLGGGSPDATVLHRLLVEDPAQDEQAGPFSVIVSNYVLDQTPAQADLLTRMARIAARAQAPFLAAVPLETLDRSPDDLPAESRDAWTTLRALSEAAYLGLGTPRFLLRTPYGKKTEPIESFRFEEVATPADQRRVLWANPAVAVGLVLGLTYRQQGDAMKPGAIAGLEEMPYYTYTDADGDQAALPCTERLLSAGALEAIAARGFLPLAAVKNSPEVRVGAFRAVGGSGVLAGWWAPAPLSAPATSVAPETAEAAAVAEPDAPPSPLEPSGEAAAAAPIPPAEDPADIVAPTAAPVESTGDPELDAMLAALDPNAAPAAGAPAAEPPAPVSTGDPELDALLASMDPNAPPPAAPAAPPQEEIDPELAKLLGDLGS